MPGNPRDMITMAERRFPARIRIGVPPGGFGQRYTELTAWLDANCGADGWAMTPSGVRGVSFERPATPGAAVDEMKAGASLRRAGYMSNR